MELCLLIVDLGFCLSICDWSWSKVFAFSIIFQSWLYLLYMLYLFFCELEQFKQLWKYLYFKDEVDFTGRFSKGNHFDSVKSSIKIILFRVSVFSRLVISKLHFPRNFSFLSNLQFVCRDLSKVVSCFLTSVSVCVCVCVWLLLRLLLSRFSRVRLCVTP